MSVLAGGRAFLATEGLCLAAVAGALVIVVRLPRVGRGAPAARRLFWYKDRDVAIHGP